VRPAGIVFDCDGVLVDSEPTSCRALGDLLRERGIDLPDAEIDEHFLGKATSSVIDYCAARGVRLPANFPAIKDAVYIERARGVVRPFPGVPELLTDLRAAKVPYALATSGSRTKVSFSLAETGLARFFEMIADPPKAGRVSIVTSSEVAHGKPAPDLFLEAARRIGVETAKCLVIEDSVPGILAGAAAGMRTIAVASSLSRAALAAAGATEILDAIADVRPIVLP
jgi:beta-phosphoglucomutase-like phosphatase (HAD superfamily)